MANATPTAPAHVGQAGTKFVYVISDENGRHKIGYARRPKARLASIQTHCPDAVALRHQVEVPAADARAVERHAHWLLRDFRIKGEWFAVTLAQAVVAIEDAKASVFEGRAWSERRRGANTRHYARVHPVITLHKRGVLSDRQLKAAMLYQWAFRRAVAGCGGVISASLRKDYEGELDLRRWMISLNQSIDSRLGRDARAILQAVAAEGHAVSARALRGVDLARIKDRLARALDIVAEQPSPRACVFPEIISSTS